MRAYVFASLFWLGTAAAAWAAPLAPAVGRVVDVVIEGNERIEEATVLAVLNIRRGDDLSATRVRQAIRAVYGTGFFDDVRIETEPVGEGVRLIIRVDEKPAVLDVKLAGNKKVNEEDIREAIDIRPFSVLNDAEVKQNSDRIRDLYVEKGYYLAEVEPEIVFVEDDQVELTFRITENRKVVVQKVEFVGLENVPVAKVRKFLQVKEGGALAFLGGSGTFQRDKLDIDRDAIRFVLGEEGYLEANVAVPKVFLSPDKRYIYVSWVIDEGPRYSIGRVALDGDFVDEEGLSEEEARRIVNGTPVNVIQEEQWRKANGLRPRLRLVNNRTTTLGRGEPFKWSTVQTVAANVASLYQDQGYAFVNVNPLPYPNPKTGEADIVLEVEIGEKYRIGRIHITGNDPTFDKVIRREILVDEGDIYRGGRLNASKARIQRLGFFETVEFSNPRGDGDGVLDLNVQVTEQPTGSFSLGLGFSNLQRFTITGNIAKNNFLGLGWQMSAAINWSQLQQQFNVSFFDPYFLDSRWTFRFNAYSQNQQFVTDFNQYQRGGSLEIGRYLDPTNDYRLAFSYTFEDVGIAQLSAYRERLMGGDLFRNGLTSTAGVNLNIDRRNNRIRPTKGTLFNIAARLSGGFRLNDEKVLSLLGGRFNFWEINGNFRFFYPLLGDNDKLVFRMNVTMGYAQSTDGKVLPFIHRYRAGGINSVRGYQWFSLGPTLRALASEDPGAADVSIPIGGTQTWINNFEVEAPIVRQAGISAVVFFDAGNAFGDPWGQGNLSPLDLRFAFGGGIRWLSPIGPLRFEYGIPIQPRDGEKKTVFDFGIGSFF
jgi:outer membrane protein insertion porin family